MRAVEARDGDYTHRHHARTAMLALVREVSPQLAHCELTHLARSAIDARRAALQHRAYTQALQALGCTLEWLPPLPDYPDSVFVEDTAVPLTEVAVITRPGAHSRRGETPTMAAALERHATLGRITEPGCLDGGDVLRIERTLYVGASGRSNAAGIAQLAQLAGAHGYHVEPVALAGCLHLKSACSLIPPELLLVNPDWVDAAAFGRRPTVAVADGEPYAANTLTVGGTTLVSAAYPQTQRRLEAAGVRTQAIDVTELHKAEGGLTCMSVLLG
jgi:dimethylargininase